MKDYIDWLIETDRSFLFATCFISFIAGAIITSL